MINEKEMKSADLIRANVCSRYPFTGLVELRWSGKKGVYILDGAIFQHTAPFNKIFEFSRSFDARDDARAVIDQICEFMAATMERVIDQLCEHRPAMESPDETEVTG